MGNTLDNRLTRLLVSHGFFIYGKIFFEIFMNIHIWKNSKSFDTVAWFNIIYLFSHAAAFTIFAHAGKKGKMHLLRKFGLLGIFLTYLIIVMNKKSEDYLIFIGILAGVSSGLYWIGYKIIRFDITRLNNRGNYTGVEKAIKISAGIIVPVSGGFIISSALPDSGYSTIYILGAFFFIASFIAGNIKLPATSESGLNLVKTCRILCRNPDIMKSMAGYFCSGFCRSGSLVRMLIPLLLFDILQNEFHLGGWQSVFSLTSVFVSVSIGKYVRGRQYRNMMTLGGSLFSVSIYALIGFPVLVTYILFGICKEILFLFIDIPKKVVSENLIHCMESWSSHRVEYIVIREWFQVGFGRIISYIILFWGTGFSIHQLKYIMFFMATMAVAETMLLRSVKIVD